MKIDVGCSKLRQTPGRGAANGHQRWPHANSVVINAPPKRGQQRITHQFGAMFASILLREWFDERDTAAEAAKL
jgi:hypothetical protein